MSFLSFVNLTSYQNRKSKIVFINSSDDKILSLIKKAWYACTFLNHFREANEQLLCALFLQNRLCCYSFLHRTSLPRSNENNVKFNKKCNHSIDCNKLKLPDFGFLQIHKPFSRIHFKISVFLATESNVFDTSYKVVLLSLDFNG